jgi:hypothetical protein
VPTRSIWQMLLSSPSILYGCIKTIAAQGKASIVRYFSIVIVLLLKQAFNLQSDRIQNKLRLVEEKDVGYVLLNILSESHFLNYGINGILHIVCESTTSDRHGIIQRDLQKLITSLVDLHEVISIFKKKTKHSIL